MSIKLGLLASSQQQAAPLLLDAYPGAVGAYSFRKLRSAYTGFCCQVFDGGSLIDIGFVNNYVDLVALSNLGPDLWVVNWYDQSGNGNDLYRFQVQGGLIKISNVLQTINGKVTINYNGKQDSRNSNSINLKNGFSNFTAGRINTTTNIAFLFTKNSGDVCLVAVQQFNYWSLSRDNVADIARQNNDAPTTFSLFGTYYDGLNGVIKHNGTIQATGVYSNVGMPNNVYLNIPGNDSANVFNNANITESIFYQSTQLANQSGIDANINSYYSIY